MKHIFLSLLLAGMWWCPAAAQQAIELNLLHTSDTHSRIEPLSPQAADANAGMGGVVRRATLVKDFRTGHPGTLLFDCGDISQGTPYYNLFKGELEVKMMNLMHYDAMAIGNHEFDFGLDNMARLFRMADFPVVCANYDVTGTVLEGLVKPYVVIERDGLKIGVFGLGPKLEGLVASANCQGIGFRNPFEAAQQTADLLRDRLGCDLVVCLSHLGISNEDPEGFDDLRLIARTRHIDVVLGGHSHTFMEKPRLLPNADGHEIPLLHSGKNGVYVGHLKVTLQSR